MKKHSIFLALLLVLATLSMCSSLAYGDTGVVVFGKGEPLLSEHSYSVVDSGVVTHLVCDLDAAGDSYNVYQDGVPVSGSPLLVDSYNTISFESSGGGSFLITKAAVTDMVTITGGPSGSPGSVASSGSVNCSVTAFDSLGHALSYQWSATGGSFSNSTAQNPTWYAPVNMSGATQSYTLSVISSCGAESAGGSYTQYVLSVVDLVTITGGPSGSPDPVVSGGTITCSVSAEDTLGHSVGYQWNATGGSFSNSTAQNPTWYAPTNTSGATQTYTVSVTASCAGDSANDSFTVQVLSVPDSMTLTSGPSGSPGTVSSGGAVSCSASAEDTLGHSVGYQWSATGGSFSNSTAQNPTWDAPVNTSGATQTYTVSVTASCAGDSASGSFAVQVLSVPDAVTLTSGPSGSPGTVASGGAVSCSASADDSLGHTVGYQWSATGGSFGNSTAQNPTWYAPTNTSGSTQTYTVSVTASCGGATANGSFTAQVLTAPVDDADGDGVSDGSDNCPSAYNPDQLNTDGDAFGDVCDDDDDNDGYSDALEDATGSDSLDANEHPPASTLTLTAVDTLLGPGATTRLDVLGEFYPTLDGPLELDMTCMVAYEMTAPGIVSIDACGNMTALSDGVVSVRAVQIPVGSAAAKSAYVEFTVDTVAPYVDMFETLPYDGQGLDEDSNGNGSLDPGEDLDGDGLLDIDNGPTPRVQIDTGIVFRVIDEALGSNVGIDSSSVSMIVNGIGVAAQMREISLGDAHEVDIVANNPGPFAFDEVVIVELSLSDVAGNVTLFEQSFRIESAADYQWALDNAPVQQTADLGDGTFELSVFPIPDSIDDEALEGAVVVYMEGEGAAPRFGPVGELPALDLATPVGIPMNIEPGVVFDGPVTVLVPAPSALLADTDGNGVPDAGLDSYSVYHYSAEPSIQWRESGDARGCIVEGSRVNRYDTVPPSIEIQVARAGGVQIGFALCEAPQAAFAALSPQVDAGRQIAFFDESTGSISSWHWNFGDGTTSDERDPAHVYWYVGDYNVTLTVSGPCGEDTLIKYGSVSVCDGISLIEPINGQFTQNNPTFAWESSCHTEFVAEFSEDMYFSSILKEVNVVSRTEGKVHRKLWQRVPELTVIYWRVRSADGTSYSPVWGFSKY